MSIQIDAYERFIMAIDRTLQCKKELVDPDLPLSFDWKKVKWAFDFWMTEQYFKKSGNRWWLLL